MTTHSITVTPPPPNWHTVKELATKYLDVPAERLERTHASEFYRELVADLAARLATYKDVCEGFLSDFEPPCAYTAHRDSVEQAVEAVEEGIRDRWALVSHDFLRLTSGR